MTAPSTQALTLVCERRSADTAPPPLLTILVGAYQHADYIGECIGSVLRGASGELADLVDLIVIDDGSTDATVDAARRALAGGTVAHRLYVKPNRGVTDTLDIGLALARAPFFAPIAADDAYVPDGLRTVLRRLPDAPRERMTVFQAEYFEELSGPVYGPAMASLFAADPIARLRMLCLEFPKPLLLQSTVSGTDFLRSVAPWRDRLLLDDWPAFVRVAQSEVEGHGTLAFDSGITLSRYRVHAGGAHRKLDRQLRACLEVVEKVVPATLRAQSRSRVFSDIGLIHLYERRPGLFLRMWLQALRSWPRPDTLGRVLGRVGRAAWRRVALG